MEIWDGYNADMSFAGIDIIRGEEPPLNLYHWVAQVIVRHTDGTYLIMRRDLKKESSPGEWEIGAGGSVLKGESPYEGAKRELYEETGIIADNLIPLQIISEKYSEFRAYNTHYSMFLCVTDVEKTSITLQEGETIDFCWVDLDEILKRNCVPARSVAIVKALENQQKKTGAADGNNDGI